MMPWFASGTVLVTSRLPLCWEDAKEVSIGAISMDAAVAMLARLSRPGQQPLPSERGHFERLAAALGRQPLALRLAGLSMADARSNAEQFLAKLAESAGSTAGAQWTQVANWLALTSKVIRQSVGRLDATGRLYLQMFASLAPEPAAIPTAIFSGRSDDEQIHATLQRLEKLGLIESIDEGKSVMMHRSVREMIRDRMSPEEQATALDAARALIEAALPRSERSSSGASVREKLVPHCRVLLGQLNGHPLEIHATRLAHGLAAWLRDCRRSSEAEHFQRRALAIAEKSCEKGHPDLIPELRHLAVILRENRSYDQAEALHRRAIAILEEQPASETKDLISELYGLGSCLRAAARYDEAEEVLLRILHLEEKHYGPAHPRTSIAAHALGAVYELAGRPQDAIPLYRRALQIDEKTRAIGAQRLAVRYHHLAGAVLAIGRLSEAVTLHEKGIELDEQSIGSDAPEIAPPLKQLADIYLRQNRLDMAENALRRILKLESTGIGEEHIEYALTLIALADLLQKSSRGDEALTLAEKAKAIVDRWATSRRNCHPLVRIVCGEADRILGAGESTR
jgi:tetratricopeptide (TPR) repeat protein